MTLPLFVYGTWQLMMVSTSMDGNKVIHKVGNRGSKTLDSNVGIKGSRILGPKVEIEGPTTLDFEVGMGFNNPR